MAPATTKSTAPAAKSVPCRTLLALLALLALLSLAPPGIAFASSKRSHKTAPSTPTLYDSQAIVVPAPVHLDAKGEKWATTTLHRMTTEEKIGQLIMPWAKVQFRNTKSPESRRLRDDMLKYHVGGFGLTVFTEGGVLLKSEPIEAAALTNALQRGSKYPLLIAADFERGLSMRLNGATAFPAAMAFGATGDPDLARQFGIITARESRAIGVQWNWYPVADVNSNPANPIINTRSFGEDPQAVSAFVDAYIQGARSAGMLTTVKHFPGHGDTDTDTHLALATSNASLARLNQIELVPFRNAIAAGVDSVMTAHITVPALEPDPNRPASISYNVITGLLKGQLGFHGLVVTDALDMAGLMRAFHGNRAEISAQEAVAAIQAGNDMVIIPADLEGAYNGLLHAVHHGTLTLARIDESVLKILRIKASVGLDRARLVSLAAVADTVATPEDLAFAQSVADRAITLVRNQKKLLPLTPTAPQAAGAAPSPASDIVAVLFTDDPRGSEGARAFAQQLRLRVPTAQVFMVDENSAAYLSRPVLTAVAAGSRVIAVAEAFPSARHTTPGHAGGSAALGSHSAALLTDVLSAAPNRTILAAFGSPYTASDLDLPNTIPINTYLCTFSNTPVAANSLARALFGEIPIQGHLPVTIPNFAPRGTGILRPAVSGQ